MKTSEQTNEIAAALAKAQGKIKNPEKNRTAEYPTKSGHKIKYNYADLPACLEVAKVALSENGLAFVTTTGFVDKYYMLFLRLTHSSGQWYESEWPLPSADEPKATASSITYGTRYLFCSMVGIAGDDDTDSEPEVGGSYQNRKPIAPAIVAPKPYTPPVSDKHLLPAVLQNKWPGKALNEIDPVELRDWILKCEAAYKLKPAPHWWADFLAQAEAHIAAYENKPIDHDENFDKASL